VSGDWKGILYYELLPNETINSEKYCFQLDELKTAIETSKNSESEGHVSSGQCAASCVFGNSTKVVGARLGYSTPSIIFTRGASRPLISTYFNYFIISLNFIKQNSLNGKSFNSLVEVKNHLEKFFAEKPERFWKDGIFKMPER